MVRYTDNSTLSSMVLGFDFNFLVQETLLQFFLKNQNFNETKSINLTNSEAISSQLDLLIFS